MEHGTGEGGEGEGGRERWEGMGIETEEEEEEVRGDDGRGEDIGLRAWARRCGVRLRGGINS